MKALTALVAFICLICSGCTPTQGTTSWHGSKAGERNVLTIAGVKYAFRWCPSGTFTMGSPTSEADRSNDEIPHKVTLTKGFWMLETEVTQEMWENVMGSNPSPVTGDKRLPVVMVSWEDCQEFIRKLNEVLPGTLVPGSVCPRKRNGNTLAERVRPRPFILVAN